MRSARKAGWFHPKNSERSWSASRRRDGVVRVKDVVRVELGAQAYSVAGRLNGKPSAIVAVYQLPGSNAVDIEDRCRETGAACSISLRMVSRCGLYQMTASATFVP